MLQQIVSDLCLQMKLPDPVAFTYGGVSFYWFGVLFAIGLILALVFIYIEVTRKGLDPDTWIDLCIVLIPCGIVGARLWYVLGHFAGYRGALSSIFMVWDGGMSIYGAFAFCLLGLYLYSRGKKVRFRKLLDVMAPGILLAQAVIIWGDFFQQRDYGHLVKSPALQWFPFAVLIERTDSIHYAVFFYEFLICLAIFALLWFVLRKRVTHDGELFCWYLTLFFGARMLLNLLRDNDTTLSGQMRPTQLFCILLFCLGLIALLVLHKRPADAAFIASAPAGGNSDTVSEALPEETEAPASEESAPEAQAKPVFNTAEPDATDTQEQNAQ